MTTEIVNHIHFDYQLGTLIAYEKFQNASAVALKSKSRKVNVHICNTEPKCVERRHELWSSGGCNRASIANILLFSNIRIL